MTSLNIPGVHPPPIIHKVISPLRIPISKHTQFTLNLNHYRNAHYQTLNKSKVNYKEHMRPQIMTLPTYEKLGLMFTLFPGTSRLTDVANICSVHEKYFADALVEFGKLPDDNYQYLPETGYRFGSVDRDNPRVEITIHPLTI